MKRAAATLALATVGSMGIANALVAFSTFLPGDVYEQSSGYAIGGPSSTSPQIMAMQFTSGLSGQLDYIRYAHFYSGGNTGITVTFHEDDGSDQIGTQLNSWFITDGSFSPHITSLINLDSSIVLAAGEKYWVKVSTQLDGSHVWNFADSTVPRGRLGFSSNDGSTYTYLNDQRLAAFDINVVPEPAAMTALALGASVLVARRRRRSHEPLPDAVSRRLGLR